MEDAQQSLLSNVSRESKARLEAYVNLLASWQDHINLIGPTTVSQIWERHVIDSLQLLPLLPPIAKEIADLGSGAGFPGLVLSIVSNLKVHLYEVNRKRLSFLREAIRQTASHAQLHPIRIEGVSGQKPLPLVDVVTARALAPLNKLLCYAEPFLTRGAIGLFHKGQDVDVELTEATKYWRINSIKHPSVTDSKSAILEVKEAIRVRSKSDQGCWSAHTGRCQPKRRSRQDNNRH